MRGKHNPGFHSVRHDRLLQAHVHDAYKTNESLPEPSVCPQCGAIYHHGRWQWGNAPVGAHAATCPACHRIHDHFPAGYLILKGIFIQQHKDDVIGLVRNEEKRERIAHPLKRIISIEDKGKEILVTTTDINLASSIGDALHQAYKGELVYQYNPAQNLLRVEWVN